MDRATFDALVEDTVEKTANLLIAKGAEYAGDVDRLANFKRNAAKNQQTVLETWQTYWGKHIDSINTYMARVKNHAVELALFELFEIHQDLISRLPMPGALSISDHEKLAVLADPVAFAKLVDHKLPTAMKEIDSTLSEPIEGRFHDNINYSFLCLALLKEVRTSAHPSL